MKFVVSNHLSSDEFMHVISKRFCPKMKEGSNKEGCTSCVRDILFIYDVQNRVYVYMQKMKCISFCNELFKVRELFIVNIH